MSTRKFFLLLAVGLLPQIAVAETVTMRAVDSSGVGDSIGTVTLRDTPKGLELTPDLSKLPPGSRGFHVHMNPDCGPGDKDGKPTAALKAGDHLDPEKAGKHDGPEGHGHLGDLPALLVSDDGRATAAVIAPRLSLEQVKGRSLMVHAGGDNYKDQPQPLGGGGARIACGIIN